MLCCRSGLWLVVLALLVSTAATATPAKWTVMLYMNGVNDLESYTVKNFEQAAAVGSTSDLNVVAQLGRLGQSATTNPQWHGVLRFRIESGTRPLPEDAVDSHTPTDMDMGSPDTLADFVTWATDHYPAEHYMLVIGAHGQGYRLTVNNRDDALPIGIPTKAPFRTVSRDDLHKSKLYMRDVQDVLLRLKALNRPNPIHIDVLGFDACLMAMVETAFAVRNATQVLVASQEIEPGFGWQYTDWLSRLRASLTATPAQVGQILVESYKLTYQAALAPGGQFTTLSATELSQLPPLTAALSDLSSALIANVDAELAAIKTSRLACLEYGRDADGRDSNDFHDVDIACFTAGLQKSSRSASIRTAAQAVQAALAAAMIDVYFGDTRAPSSGLCIYFPASGQAYTSDGFAENGYEPDNTFKEVEFVKTQNWTTFLHEYFKRVPS